MLINVGNVVGRRLSEPVLEPDCDFMHSWIGAIAHKAHCVEESTVLPFSIIHSTSCM